MIRLIPLWITLVASLPTLAMWALFLSNQFRVSNKLGISLAGTLFLDQPATRESIAYHLPNALSPLFVLREYPKAFLFVLAPTVAAVVLLIAARSSKDPWATSRSLLCLAALPLLGGLFQLPVLIVRGAEALANAGLSNVALFGTGLAEALALPIWGLAISIVLLVVFWKFRPRV